VTKARQWKRAGTLGLIVSLPPEGKGSGREC
jgi:hypothetical protein